MNYVKSIAILGVLYLVITSCEKDINFTFPDESEKLVVNGHFAKGDSILYVTVSHSKKVTDTTDLKNIDNAKVEFYQEEELLGQLNYKESTSTSTEFGLHRNNYVLENINLQENIPYTLKVSAPDYEEVETTDIIPTISATSKALIYTGKNEGGPSFFSYSFTDISPERNYYLLELKRIETTWALVNGNREIQNVSPERSDIFQIVENEQNDFINTAAKGFLINSGIYQSYVISDELLNETEIKLNLEVYVFGLGDSIEEFGSYYDFRVELRCISENYYKYLLTLRQQVENAEDPFAEPSPLHNNVKNGLGNFSGYNVIYSDYLRVE